MKLRLQCIYAKNFEFYSNENNPSENKYVYLFCFISYYTEIWRVTIYQNNKHWENIRHKEDL